MKKSIAPEKGLSYLERSNFGKSLRKKTSRASHSQWKPPSNRNDPIDILIKSNEGRLEDLIPVRFGKMAKSPFAFLRGSASIMASDLSKTPASGLQTQSCGDCHLVNFGAYATPERNIVFDMNDFDETHIAPWEWDLKRLAVSFIVAGREKNYSDKINKRAVLAVVRSYLENMRNFSSMKILDVWYSKVDENKILKTFSQDKEYIKNFIKSRREFRKNSDYNNLSKLIERKHGEFRIKDQKPVIYHSDDIDHTKDKMSKFFSLYKDSLPEEKKYLFNKFKFTDVAYKVAGVGSVGTRCYIALFTGEDKTPLLLQVKEARQSVLAPFTQKSKYTNNGERIVTGQRLMQAASDIFLGWTKTDDEKHFYVRQLRDLKIETKLETQSAEVFIMYAELCGKVLAKSHSKAGDVAEISGYLGKSEEFDNAIADFAFKYAKQNEDDFESFKKAIKDKRIEVSW